MRYIPLLAAAAAFATPAAADHHLADEIADDAGEGVSQERLKSDVYSLVGFGTRHTLSEQDNPERGIGAARKWGEGEFRKASEACGGCLEIVLPERMVQGRRIPEPTRLVNVVAIQRGTERPNEVVIVQGHIDSRATDAFDFTSDAPGANDDASGTAVAIEAARVLSQRQYPTTIVYALLSGEEQGLYGGQLMADYAEEQGWTVKAVLNNDIVGGSCGSDGYCDADHIRVFSEGPRADLTDTIRAAQRRNGGENDSPSRNLSRWLDGLAEDNANGLDVRQIWRTDRMGRGGDQIPFLEKGYPAIRFSVAVEDYEHQHQDLRVEDGITYGDTPDEMDFAYLAKAAQLNVRALDKLAMAPMPPAPVAQAAVRTFTEIEWEPVEGAFSYTIWQRRPDEPYWREEPVIENAVATSARLEGVRGDDWIFGVSSSTAGGHSSPIASAVPAGSYAPIPQEEGDTE
ncbi:M20/M25/M40 family metallo-hydrolase [Altererythrobacter luteolus]|uniref:M20/M25/M40 family metallo-hydrolase n=1 Tax=Pontixanthobacter luteolus TaxID=295089 RepID=A0A6I4V1B5_9SPHN|nr:M20/M25/M40 family metallo-hydrolase [Pontixanthobacter luteolus]MXP46630.1 M20/M25/M40 family metallo-hydrolase [Pontixanthobacter luteolus]